MLSNYPIILYLDAQNYTRHGPTPSFHTLIRVYKNTLDPFLSS